MSKSRVIMDVKLRKQDKDINKGNTESYDK